MSEEFSRSELIFGKENIEKIAKSKVLIFGIGGVGSYTAEALSRSGIGTIGLVDSDKICLSNINRQLYALHSTVDKYKVDVAEERIHDINPACKVIKYKIFYTPQNADKIDFLPYDYIIDCIDTVSGKIEIIKRAKECGKNIISCMGAGNKIDPTLFQVADISKTSVCPLARVMRSELKKRGIKEVKCLYSTEKIISRQKETNDKEETDTVKKRVPGSNAFTPSVAGLIIASEVIKDLCAE